MGDVHVELQRHCSPFVVGGVGAVVTDCRSFVVLVEAVSFVVVAAVVVAAAAAVVLSAHEGVFFLDAHLAVLMGVQAPVLFTLTNTSVQ